VGPSGQAGKRKRVRFGSGLKVSWAGSVGPTRLGSVRGSTRPAAQQAGSGSGLARRASQPRLPVLRGRRVLCPDSFMGRWWAGGLLSFSSSSSLAGLLPLLFLLADRSAPRVSLGGIQCGGAWIRCGRWACACACGRRGCVCEASAQWVLEEMPKGFGRDVAAALRGHCTRRGRGGVVARRRRRRRGEARADRSRHGPCRSVRVCVLVTSWPPRVAARRSRRWSRAKAGLGRRLGFMAWVCTHARGSWLPRAAAWPYRARGTGIPGLQHDAAMRGDGGCGARRRRVGSLHESGTMAGRERGSLGFATDGSSAALGITAAAGGWRERGRCSPAGLKKEALRTVER
jgi:hypothetical protein